MAVDVKSMTKTKPLLPYLICKPSGVLVLSPLALCLSRSSGSAAAAIPGADVHARTHTLTRVRARTYLSIEPCALSHTPSNTHAPLYSSRIFILHTHAHDNCIERPCMYTVNHVDINIMCYIMLLLPLNNNILYIDTQNIICTHYCCAHCTVTFP